jgi:hypothetical protein
VSEQVITNAELNRATLARQMLLARESLDVVTAIERLVALQAQEPPAPFIGLWTRLNDFHADALIDALERREIVKATLMRVTLHMVSARDYLRLLPAVLPLLRNRSIAQRGGELATDDVLRLSGLAAAYAAEPRLGAEIRDHVAAHAPDADPEILLWRVRRHQPFVQVPSRSTWAYGPRPRFIAPEAWLPGEMASQEESTAYLVGRYLAAFGPATKADLMRWSGLNWSALANEMERVEPRLVRFRAESGSQLFDLADAPRPPADTPAPARLLTMWDSAIIGYADKDRIVPPVYRARIVNKRGDYFPTFLVDGRVAGLWRLDPSRKRVRIELLPFGRIPSTTRRELDEEADRLASFLDPLDRRVFTRYDRWIKEAAAL